MIENKVEQFSENFTKLLTEKLVKRGCRNIKITTSKISNILYYDIYFSINTITYNFEHPVLELVLLDSFLTINDYVNVEVTKALKASVFDMERREDAASND